MITAIILAAGESRRMGQAKMLLPWGETTVLGQVLATFRRAGADNLLVVTGGARKQVEELIGESAGTVYNPEFASGEMLSSVQCGLQNLTPETKAVLIGLGDQPLVREHSVRILIGESLQSRATIIVPSYHRRRGHPWLVSAVHWGEILLMRAPSTLRDFLQRHLNDIHYVEVDDPGILQDLDTPEDYEKHKKSIK